MNRHSCLTDITALQSWYLALNTPQWNLYRGFHNKMPVNAILKQQNDQLPLQDSWDLLANMINAQSSQGGQFTVYVPAYAGGKGAVQHLSINMALSPSVAGYGVPNAGLAGYPPNMSDFVSAQELERRISDERERWELKKKVEDMESQLDSATDWQDIVMAKVMEIDPNTIVANLGGFLQQFMAPKPGVQLRGLAHEMAPPVASGEDTDQPEEEVYHYPTERLVPALDTIRQHFESDEAFMLAFEQLAVMFNQNPEFFKGQLK